MRRTVGAASGTGPQLPLPAGEVVAFGASAGLVDFAALFVRRGMLLPVTCWPLLRCEGSVAVSGPEAQATSVIRVSAAPSTRARRGNWIMVSSMEGGVGMARARRRGQRHYRRARAGTASGPARSG